MRRSIQPPLPQHIMQLEGETKCVMKMIWTNKEDKVVGIHIEGIGVMKCCRVLLWQ